MKIKPENKAGERKSVLLLLHCDEYKVCIKQCPIIPIFDENKKKTEFYIIKVDVLKSKKHLLKHLLFMVHNKEKRMLCIIDGDLVEEEIPQKTIERHSYVFKKIKNAHGKTIEIWRHILLLPRGKLVVCRYNNNGTSIVPCYVSIHINKKGNVKNNTISYPFSPDT